MMSEQDTNAVAGIIFDEATEITVVKLCEVCAIDRQTIDEMIAEGILEPTDITLGYLPYSSVRRTRTVIHLQRDLGVNMAGAALALELLEHIDSLRAQLRRR
jgi:chaperone modulatory protein CbpM